MPGSGPNVHAHSRRRLHLPAIGVSGGSSLSLPDSSDEAESRLHPSRGECGIRRGRGGGARCTSELSKVVGSEPSSVGVEIVRADAELDISVGEMTVSTVLVAGSTASVEAVSV